MHENDFFNEDLLCALAGVAGEDNVLMSEPMREHTTFKIGGPADVFVTPDTEQGLVATLDTCYRCDLPLTIVGNGSDLLVGDKGIRGVVVALGEGLSDITVNGTHVTAAAGALLSDVAAAAAEAGLTGMEPISGIPGSVGGACYMTPAPMALHGRSAGVCARLQARPHARRRHPRQRQHHRVRCRRA